MTFPAAGNALPALPPIKTRAAAAANAPEPASAAVVGLDEVEAEPSTTAAAEEEEAEPMTTAAAAVAEEEEEEGEAEPRTPTSEESKLRPPIECPPAPRKPAWTAPRTRPSSAAKRRLYFDVPRDLSAVFRSLPPKKRIRAPPCSGPCRPRSGAARADGSAL